MSKVILNISGTQSYRQDEESTEMTVVGELLREEDNYILTYPDGADCETTICVTPHGAVEVSKESPGDDESYQMIFEQSKTFSSYYDTPFGKTDALIFPTLVDAQMCDNAGSIELEYVVRVLGQQIINQRSLTYARDNYQQTLTGENRNEN